MSPTPGSTPVQVLLVEDNRDDAALITRALREAKIRNHVHVAENGEQALVFLNAPGASPDLILLDLNLPGMDGRLLLEQIKLNERLRHIPVVVLSGSRSEQDIAQSYALHANAYVVKPIEPKQFLAAINAIEQFWLEIVKLP